jgi:DNA-binding MarR family transcriptional regulator
MSRTVAALEERSLVRCVANRSDGRSVLVMSTAKGRATLEKGIIRTLQELADLLARFQAADLQAMADLIQRVRAARR